MKSQIKQLISDSIKAKECLYMSEADNIEKAVKAIIRSLRAGGKLLIFGNGGSAADSQHIAAEFVGRFKMERRALPAIALTVNTSAITAIANDYGYDVIFSRQIEALGSGKDIALGISTSGNAKNVISGVKMARSLGMTTISLTGGNGGGLKKLSDISIVAGSKDTPRIQESHILIAHIICELVEQGLFGKR